VRNHTPDWVALVKITDPISNLILVLSVHLRLRNHEGVDAEQPNDEKRSGWN
jgi:hypothetical protein